MNQEKIGSFLKELRKEKGLTQEQLAEKFNISGRTVSRWENGNNMPDLSILVDLSDFYNVDIREIIDGERKSEKMNEEMKDTLVKVAEYSREDQKIQFNKMRNLIGNLLMAFGIFLILSAFAIFPSESSWGGIYSILGDIILVLGIYQKISSLRYKIIYAIGSFIIILFCLFAIDYAGVVLSKQPPRFRYETLWDSRNENELIYKTPFYTVIRHNVDTENEYYEIK